jgi:hypothetical protein
MEARGYGQKSHISNFKSQILMVGGLSGILLGWLMEAYWRNGAGWAVIVASAIAVVIGIRMATAHAPQTTHYKPQAWSTRDTLLAALSALPLAAIVIVALLDPPMLVFYPYPRVTLPPFDVRIGLCLALLGAPAFMRSRSEHQRLSPSVTTAGK